MPPLWSGVWQSSFLNSPWWFWCEWMWRKSTLLCIFPLLLTQSTSLLALPVTRRRVGGSPHQAVLCDTSRVSRDLTPFWCCVPGDSIRSHRLRKGSVLGCWPSLQMTVTGSRSPGYTKLLSDLATSWRLPWPPPPWVWLFARAAHRTQGEGNTYVYQFIKEYRWVAI